MVCIAQKAQISLEFIIMLSMGGVLLAMFVVLANHMVQDQFQQNHQQQVNDLVFTIRSELLLAAQAEDGYQRSFNITSTLENQPYTLSNGERYLTVTHAQGATRTVIIPNNTGTLVKGGNLIIKNSSGLFINP